MIPPPSPHQGNVAAVKRLLAALADLLPGSEPAQPQDPLGNPKVPNAKAYIAEAIGKDIARGRVRS